MASRLFCRGSRNAVSLAAPGIRIATNACSFSSYDERQPFNGEIVIEVQTKGRTAFQWPDTRLGPLEPKDRRFPLPGLVGSPRSHRQVNRAVIRYPKIPRYDADVLIAELPHERQSSTFEQFMVVSKQATVESKPSTGQQKLSPFDRLECVAYDCPFLLRKDFHDMFPNCQIRPHDGLTVITFCQKADSDANTNGKQQPELLPDFIGAATEVCEALHGIGFWADFLDPLSGRPFLGIHTNAAIYEVDDRYRRFGFEIDDSTKQCRVLRHHALGTRPFVGCAFTNTPTTHPFLVELLQLGEQSTTASK